MLLFRLCFVCVFVFCCYVLFGFVFVVFVFLLCFVCAYCSCVCVFRLFLCFRSLFFVFVLGVCFCLFCVLLCFGLLFLCIFPFALAFYVCFLLWLLVPLAPPHTHTHPILISWGKEWIVGSQN